MPNEDSLSAGNVDTVSMAEQHSQLGEDSEAAPQTVTHRIHGYWVFGRFGGAAELVKSSISVTLPTFARKNILIQLLVTSVNTVLTIHQTSSFFRFIYTQ